MNTEHLYKGQTGSQPGKEEPAQVVRMSDSRSLERRWDEVDGPAERVVTVLVVGCGQVGHIR